MKKKKKKDHMSEPRAIERKQGHIPWLTLLRGVASLSVVCFFLPFFLFSHSGLFSGHDIQAHTTYLVLFTKAIASGQFPVRWIAWPIPGFDQPLFTFYSPLFYYLFLLPHALGFANTTALKIEVSTLWVVSGVGMYLFAKEHFGRLPAAFAALLFLFAPYHIEDVFVRAAFPEFCALSFVPWVFWALKRLSSIHSLWYFCISSVCIALLFLSHSPTVVIFAPFLSLYVLYLSYEKKSLTFLSLSIASLLFGVGLASFFLLPAFFQQNMIQPLYLHSGYYDFHDHFVCLSQLFLPNWGYGVSLPHCESTMSFQVGILNWVIILGSGGVFIWKWREERVHEKLFFIGIFSFFLFACCMMLPLTQRIWESAMYLAFVQYPWRFLSLAIFLAAFLGAYLLWRLSSLARLSVYCLGVVCLLLLIVPYLHPALWSTDLSSVFDSGQVSSSFQEKGYMPGDALILPDPATVPQTGVKLLAGQATVLSFQETFTQKNYVMRSLTPTHFIFYTHTYPGWEAFVDGKQVPTTDNNLYGFLELTTGQGTHHIVLRLASTALEKISNGISFGFLCLLGFLFCSVVWKRYLPSLWQKTELNIFGR